MKLDGTQAILCALYIVEIINSDRFSRTEIATHNGH